MLSLQHVSKVYQTGKTSVTALRDVSFEVRPSDFAIIRGPSGSGKSTLLNIMGLLDAPSGGEVRLNGETVSYRDYDRLAVQRSMVISFIFQSFNLNPVLSLEENIMVPLMIRADVSRRERRRRVDEWVEKIGLAEHRHHRPEELSGGQRQRVAIARAMVTAPGLVIADEPTASLDSETTRRILGLMKELNERQGTAFVFATHDPILDDYARSRWLIRDGRLSQGD